MKIRANARTSEMTRVHLIDWVLDLIRAKAETTRAFGASPRTGRRDVQDASSPQPISTHSTNRPQGGPFSPRRGAPCSRPLKPMYDPVVELDPEGGRPTIDCAQASRLYRGG